MGVRDTISDLCDRFGDTYIDEIVGTWLGRNKSAVMFPKPEKPARAPHYLVFVRQLPCVSCGLQPSEAHHFGPRGMGQKTDDYRAVPLCRTCHQKFHDGKLSRDLEAKMIDVLVRYLRSVEGT